MSDTYEYPYIRIWGIYLGSTGSFIEGEIKKAQKEGAPQGAIYKNSGDREGWSTVDQIANLFTLHGMQIIAARMDLPEITAHLRDLEAQQERR